MKVLLGCMVTRVSKNGSVPCCDGSSIVNWMCGSWLLMFWSSDLLCSAKCHPQSLAIGREGVDRN